LGRVVKLGLGARGKDWIGLVSFLVSLIRYPGVEKLMVNSSVLDEVAKIPWSFSAQLRDGGIFGELHSSLSRRSEHVC